MGIGTTSPSEKLDVVGGSETRLVVGTGANFVDTTTGIDFTHKFSWNIILL